MKTRVLFTRGTGMIEMVVGVAILTTVFVGMFGVLQLGTRLATDNKARTGALALAQERIEYLRSLQYDAVGTIGGDPSGSLATSESIVLNNIDYTRQTYIVYIDDPKDGSGGADSNGIRDDYKRIKVTVSWLGPKNREREAFIITDIAPLRVES